MAESLRKRDRLLYGVILPIGIMAFCLFLVMLTDTRAGAAEFAALGIFLGAIIVTPVVLLVNLVLAFQAADTAKVCLNRGMIEPVIVVIFSILFQALLWDALT